MKVAQPWTGRPQDRQVLHQEARSWDVEQDNKEVVE